MVRCIAFPFPDFKRKTSSECSPPLKLLAVAYTSSFLIYTTSLVAVELTKLDSPRALSKSTTAS